MSGDGIGKGLAAFLSREWDTDVVVRDVRVASAGARRRNVLFSARRGDEELTLVATIIPNPAVQIMDVEVEASALRLAESGAVPVAHVHAVCTDASFAGGPFFVTSYVEGETIPRQVLRLVERSPGLGRRLARQCGEALARLHRLDPERAHPKLARPADASPARHALQTIEPLLGTLMQPSPSLVLAFRWLERNAPASAPSMLSLVHSDFRNGNMIVAEDGLRAALDWEGCHLGDPMEDVGWLCLRMWRFRNDHLEVGGFAQRPDLRAGYESEGGSWNEEGIHWWKVMGTLRWGLGLAGQARAHLDGSVRSIVMAASGRRVAELEYDALMLLREAYGSVS